MCVCGVWCVEKKHPIFYLFQLCCYLRPAFYSPLFPPGDTLNSFLPHPFLLFPSWPAHLSVAGGPAGLFVLLTLVSSSPSCILLVSRFAPSSPPRGIRPSSARCRIPLPSSCPCESVAIPRKPAVQGIWPIAFDSGICEVLPACLLSRSDWSFFRPNPRRLEPPIPISDLARHC